MTEQASRVDSFRAVLVAAATLGVIAFNFLAATGRLNGVDYGSAVIELVERKLAWKQQHGGDVANRVVAGAAPNV